VSFGKNPGEGEETVKYEKGSGGDELGAGTTNLLIGERKLFSFGERGGKRPLRREV